ncbi:ATP-binding protein [Rubellimicrobium roseum]|uniref:histidine kinase n=1 Tax=Rubellimicrobium roseum TaxID=687525 RepID=A0A5C4N7S8_9RHOB|nr:ATP-binding protein [Rubellimicrobium roseum]TNC63118.1 HAMP domain-containing protein [Rubellimicrobium roseum]
MATRPSMRFQTAAIIVVSFLLSHAAGLLFYSLDRRGALEMTEAMDLIERAAGISRLVRELPTSWQASIVRSSDSRAFRVWVTAEPASPLRELSPSELEMDAYLRSQVPQLAQGEMRVRLIEGAGDRVIPPPLDLGDRISVFPSYWETTYAIPSVALSIRHADDEWVNFLGAIDTPRSVGPELFLANVTSAVVGIALVAFWLVSRVISPLGRLAQAAESLGRNISSEPLPVTGPREVAVAAAAFNSMQRRLLELIHGRTELLAGISHDLRTPLTQIRLRLELTPESPERDKNLCTLDEMDAIIGTFLTYARATGETEEMTRIDLGALVASVCDDLADLGAAIDCQAEPSLIIRCKRVAIRRAVTNLVENAIKYGHEAQVVVSRLGDRAVIAVEDRGPGIPEDQMQAVVRPFHRAEVSRSPDLGGVGLGLSIAQAILEDHGGEVRLTNRPQGGLRAEILLPI